MTDWQGNVVAALEEERAKLVQAEQLAAEMVAQVKVEGRRKTEEALDSHRTAKQAVRTIDQLIAKLKRNRESAAKADVVARIRKLLAENPDGIDANDLKPVVKSSLGEDGFILIGSFRHWDRWLQEMDDVIATQGRYRLVDKTGGSSGSTIRHFRDDCEMQSGECAPPINGMKRK